MNSFGLLRAPAVGRLLGGAWVGRLPTAMAALAIPLQLREVGQSYGFVGLAVGTYAIAVAALSPLLGRWVDRRGQTGVLAVTGFLAAVGFATVALAPRVPVAVVLGAAIAGAATPPLEACVRVLWPRIVRPDQVEAVYALDSAAQEMLFVVGPVVVAACVAVATPGVALWLAAVLGLVGVLVVATAEPSREWRSLERSDSLLGPLHSIALVVVLTALCGVGFAIGTLNIFVVSYAESRDVIGGAPALLALNAIGALLGVLVYGAVRIPLSLAARATLFAGGLTVAYGLLATVPSPVPLAGVMLLTGFFLAPLLTVSYALTASLAPAGTDTEAFAWLITLFATGSSLGSAVAGVVVERAGQHWTGMCAALGAAATVVILLAGRRIVTPRPVAGPAGTPADSRPAS